MIRLGFNVLVRNLYTVDLMPTCSRRSETSEEEM